MALVDVYNVNKEKVGVVDLKEDIFGVEIKPHLLHEVVVWQRACRRGGNASTKTRGEVKGSGRKPWRQKGTGRARVGTIRTPMWRGGGTVFGPRPRSYAYTLPKKVRKAALKMALSSKLANGQLVVLEDYPFTAPKTKEFIEVMKNFDLEKALFITLEGHKTLELSARNVPYVQVIPAAGLNVFDILRYDHLVLLSPVVAAIEARLAS
jgi:large subunit ribosomal protein L4